MATLYDWAERPDVLPYPLPPLSTATARRGFPVALLDTELARLLAAEGMACSRRTGFTLHGSPVSNTQTARWASLHLHMVADRLAPSRPPSEELAAMHATLEADGLDAMHRAHELTDDYEEAEHLARSMTPTAFISAPVLYARLRDREALVAADEDARHRREHWNDYAKALRATARAVKASPRAQTIALAALRELLPAPVVPDPRDLADAFLARFDDEDILPRPVLGRAYTDAGRPGGLRPSELYALATDRWRSPCKRRGTYVFRPSAGRPF